MVLEKRVPVKNGGRVARVDFGAARWREKALACGLRGRARRTRILIPGQRYFGPSCTDSNLRSASSSRNAFVTSDDARLLQT